MTQESKPSLFGYKHSLLSFKSCSLSPRALFWRLHVWFGRSKASLVEFKVFTKYKGTCPGPNPSFLSLLFRIQPWSNGLTAFLYASKTQFLGSRASVQGIEASFEGTKSKKIQLQHSNPPTHLQKPISRGQSPVLQTQILPWRVQSPFLIRSWNH